MIRQIALRDLTEFWRDGRLLWAGGIMLALILIALGVGWQRQAELQAERVAAQASDYDDWLAQPERHPHDAAHQGMHVFKPEPPLSIVDTGIAPFVGSTQWLQAHRQSETRFRPAQDATGLQRFGSLSAAWIVQVLGPLLVIVLGFNSIAGEREQGTLRQLMSLGVRARTLLLGKAAALGLAVALVLVPGALFAAAAVLAQAGDHALDAALRLGLMSLGYALYLGAVIFVVLLVSARVRTARMSLILLLGLWIATVVVLPRAVSDMSASIHPSPSRTEFKTQLDSAVGEVQAKAWQEKFGVQDGWGPDLPLNVWGQALAVNDQVSYAVLDQQFGALWDSFERQQAIQEWAGLVAPVLAVRSYSMRLAGTDFATHRDFSVAAERHRRMMQDIISHDLIEHADPLGDQHFSYDADESLWGKIPPFQYTLPSVQRAFADATPSLLILLAGFALALIGALLSIPRRPV